MESLLDGLDPDQRAAVTAPPGVVVVHAGAGSGKTTVLTRRIAHRLSNGTAHPQHTLAITFTREAAGELRRRLHAMGAISRIDGPTVTAGTFHAVAFRLLRQHCIDNNKQVPVVVQNRESLLRGLGVQANAEVAISGAIDWAHSRFMGPEHAQTIVAAALNQHKITADEFKKIFVNYESTKRKRGVLDLNDMIIRVIEEAERDPRFLESIRWQYRHIHVDEAQDMNPLQYRFLGTILGETPDLFIVGDPNQAIYGWNGSDHMLFDQLPDNLPGSTVYELPSNYRCTPEIVAAALHVLTSQGHNAHAVSRRASGTAITKERCATDVEEMITIARLVTGFTRQGVSTSDIAVLARTNWLANNIAADLRRRGVQLRTVRASRAYLDAVAEVADLGFRDELTTWAADVLDVVSTDEDDAVPEDVQNVARRVREFLTDNVGSVDGRMFRSWLVTRDPDRVGDGVEVLTVHAAKGREWPVVIVAGCEAGLMPHSSAKHPTAKAEEARLAYVALTRAADVLAITWTDMRGSRRTGPSPFLRNMPTGSITASGPSEESRKKIHAVLHPTRDDAVKRAVLEWREEMARKEMRLETAVLTDDHVDKLAINCPITTEHLTVTIGKRLTSRYALELLPLIKSVRS